MSSSPAYELLLPLELLLELPLELSLDFFRPLNILRRLDNGEPL